MLRIRVLAGALLAFALWPAVAWGAADCPGADEVPDAGNVAVVEAASLCLVNGERTDRGLGPLAANDLLARAARGHSAEMVAAGLFSHDSPDGSSFEDRIVAAGYRPLGAGWAVGENIAWGTGTLATPRAIVTAWMNSPGHRANILDSDFDEAGMGVVVGAPGVAGGGGATYTTDFGARDGATAQAQRTGTRKRARRHPRKRAHRRVRRHHRHRRH